MPKKIFPDEKIKEMMFSFLLNSFSNRYTLTRRNGDIHLTNSENNFLIKTFLTEPEVSKKGSTEEVQQYVDDIIMNNQEKVSFLFLRSKLNDTKTQNIGSFLRQSQDKDESGKIDNKNVKKITKLERAVESLFYFGTGKCENKSIKVYKSRIVYYNSDLNILQAVSFRETSWRFPISKTEGYKCDDYCQYNSFNPEEIDFKKCKAAKCTYYARGRDKREIKKTDLKLPLKMEVYEKENPLLAKIR